MIGTQFNKENLDLNAYAQAAAWCNENRATIDDKGEYYEVVAIPKPELETVKGSKIAHLKLIRDKKELEPVEYDGSSFDFDSKSYERITAAIYALEAQPAGATIAWTLSDNTARDVTAADLRGVIAAAAVRSDALHTQYRELKAAVLAAAVLTDVEKITWTEV